MKKRKLKGFVLPSIYIITIIVLAIGITFFANNLMEKEPSNTNIEYDSSVFNQTEESEEINVNNEVDNQISKPYIGTDVTISKDYYKEDDTPENQEKALIYYENTYMKNTGILYASENVFDVIAVTDGTVKEIKNDEILGTVLTLEGKNGLTCIYYTLGEVLVKEKDEVKQNDILAKSGQSQIETTKQTLLFETYLDGALTDPNNIFGKKIEELD